jgi:hypothetical protein
MQLHEMKPRDSSFSILLSKMAKEKIPMTSIPSKPRHYKQTLGFDYLATIARRVLKKVHEFYTIQ